MATTNVPAIQFTPTGLVIPTEAAVLAGVVADFNAAFGGNLNPALNTPQGQLASSLAAAISGAYAAFAAIVNGIDPDTAVAFMQDAVARIYFLTRNAGIATVVQCTCAGAVGTPINAGSMALDTSGNLYVCTNGGSIGPSGTVSLTFANVVVGAIPCPANTLTIISQAVPNVAGWEAITNPAPGVVGASIETPAALEYRRQQSVAGNAQGFLAAVYGAVFDLPGIIDVFCVENDTSGTVPYGTTLFPLAPSSIYVGIIGGTPAQIVQAIWSKKSPGCNYNGNTTLDVTDTSGNYTVPPVYPVSFNNNSQNPANVYMQVNIEDLPTLPANIITLVQTAVVNQFTGAAGAPRARIGQPLVALTYAAAVQNCAGTGVVIPVLSIAIGQAFTGTATLVDGSTTLTIATLGAGELVTFGTQVAATDIPAGTYIVQQLTGAPGGPGTYQMSAAANATVGAPEAITGTPGPAAQFGIDQAPTIAAANIAVNLVTVL